MISPFNIENDGGVHGNYQTSKIKLELIPLLINLTYLGQFNANFQIQSTQLQIEKTNN